MPFIGTNDPEQAPCPLCDGTGLNTTAPDGSCPECLGVGMIGEKAFIDFTLRSLRGEVEIPAQAPEPTIEEHPDVSRAVLRLWLAAHREIWDQPRLLRERPDILLWLMARYEVIFGMLSEAIVVDKRTGLRQPETYRDVREAVEAILLWEIERAR